MIETNGFAVRGRTNRYVVILDPEREHGFNYMTPLGQSMYVQHLADTTDFLSVLETVRKQLKITDYRNEAAWFTSQVVDMLLDDDRLGQSLLSYYIAQEAVQKEATKILRQKQMASLRSQADQMMEPKFFRSTKDELFYEFEDLYKVPDNDEDPTLCDPKHLVAKDIVDFY